MDWWSKYLKSDILIARGQPFERKNLVAVVTIRVSCHFYVDRILTHENFYFLVGTIYDRRFSNEIF